MPEVKLKNNGCVKKSLVRKNGQLNGSSIKVDLSNKIKEEEAKTLELNLITKDLSSISDNFFYRYCNLFRLDLSGNKLSTITNAIESLVNLECLLLDNNRFKKFPQVVENLVRLKELSLKSNELTEFPESCRGSASIEKLNLSDNKLIFLPVTWEKMRRLKSLDLSYNYIKSIPTSIEQGMPILEMLDLSGNRGMIINGHIYSHRIKKFYCRSNKSRRLCFPEWIFSGKYYQFDELDFENSSFSIILIPPNPKIRVRVLNLQRCNFTSKNIAAILRDIESIEYLKIGNNNYCSEGNLFTELPLELINAPQDLLEFDCRDVGLPSIPPAIKNFISITKIDLSLNHISWLPNEFCYMEKLEVLLLSRNTLIMLPQNIGQLERLRVLEISDNHISSLPESVSQLKNLQYLDLYRNDLSELPEYFKDFNNLVGLDVEQNFIDTDNCQLLMYESLREANRVYNKSELRLNGPRVEQQSTYSSRSTSSLTNSNDSYESAFDVSCSMSQECFLKNDDNWDKEYDSSDDFDAYNPPVIDEIQWQYPRNVWTDPMHFCPADLHVPRTKDIIAENYARGKYPTRPAIVEGQFDDAD
ncbi:leucine-rich repeat protein soc-2 homolog [Microplitis mediator]|uniref:leucine-rich repeat protein soc-2 homolog n=1 Tax=Microplitis mediator TaxID=375433 RepID=UPI0025529C17|nr:leucine-rich repeat protein soc-2 homolog [Microplitis mediator]